MTQIIPGQPFPELTLPKVGGGTLTLSKAQPGRMLMLDIYRGLHCPRCKAHLEQIASSLADFDAAAIDVAAASTDPADRAKQAASQWALSQIPLAYDLSIDQARTLGLPVSQSISDKETSRFAEPGIFFIRDDGTLYGSIIQTFPFARPSAADLAEIGKIAKERGYPPRGTLAD